MKAIKNIALLFFGLMFLLPQSGCKKFLEQDPISTITPESFWKDRNDAMTWRAGVYQSLQTTLRSNWFDWGEVRSDNIQTAGTGNAQTKLMNNVLSANDADINAITNWSGLYRTISLCNYGIKYYPEMIINNYEQGATEYADYLGQCYGIRALLYFYGLRVWGRIPLVNEPVEALSQPNMFARAEIADVKVQILNDIEESLKYIGNNTGQKYYMQKGAVYALQTDVYMWFKDYDLALIASQNCITQSGNQWVSSAQQWKNIFTDPVNSTETIFNLYWDNIESGGGAGFCQKLGSASNTNQYRISTAIFTQLLLRTDPVTEKKTDGRYFLSFDTISYNSPALYEAAAGQVKFAKFAPFDPTAVRPDGQPGGAFQLEGNTDCNVKMPVYRFADVMLLRAEALNRTGNPQGALDIVNRVRNRVGYMVNAELSDYTGDVTEAIERTILTERQYELLGEGKRWFDLCRIGNTYDFSNNGYEYLREVMNPILQARMGAVPYDNNALVPNGMGRILYPINSEVFNSNPKLRGDQNPPYDE